MAEQYANNAITTLASTITDIATTLVLSDASAFPATGNFRLLVDDEILVCSSRAGVTCTVSRGQEGTTAAAHTAGATVSHVLTAAALGNIIDEAIASGGGGDVVGPASSTDDRIATFDGVTGKLLQDGGQTIAQVIAAAAGGAGDVVGPGSSVDDRIATFDGATGKLIQDGGQTIAQVIAAATGGAVDSKTSIYTPFTPSGDDDEFDDGSFSGWTAVQNATPVLTITEANDRLSIYHPGGDSAAAFHAFVKARTVATNDWIEVCVKGGGRVTSYCIFGLIAADGTTYGSGKQVLFYNSPNETQAFSAYANGFNSVTINSSQGNIGQVGTDIFMRLKYVGSGNFRVYASPDGVSWMDTNNATFAHASGVTPTHLGFCLTSWGSSTPYIWSVRYVRFGNG